MKLPSRLPLLVALVAAAFAANPAGVARGQASAPVHAPAAAPAKAPARIMVPADLMTLPASRMITVNGKTMSAGAVRQDLQTQIAKQAGPPTLVKVASGKRSGASHAASSANVPSTHGIGSAPNLDCSNRSPTILEISGSASPGQEITVMGSCFGDQTGQLKLIGPFPGGVLQLTFARWSAGKIVASVPAVPVLRGVTDQTVAMSVVSAAKLESPSKPVAFVAARERVEVPGRLWTPSPSFALTWQPPPLVKPTKEQTGPTQFSVTVNPACALDTMEATATVGTVTGVTGFSDGPPNTATVQVAWTPQKTTTTYYYVVVSETDVFLSVNINVKAWASCPVGVAP